MRSENSLVNLLNLKSREKSMNPSILRQFWSMVEQTQTSTLLELSDRDLITRLQEQFEQHKYFSTNEISILHEYIQGKISLIRDLAELR